jgi:hypothetical protein
MLKVVCFQVSLMIFHTYSHSFQMIFHLWASFFGLLYGNHKSLVI